MPKLSQIRKQAVDELMKEALYEATVSVLSEFGAHGMTMERVAVAAGVAKGSLYRYFRSKRTLLEFVHSKLTDPAFEVFERLAASDQPAIDKLAEQLRWLLDHVAEHLTVHRLLFEDENAHGLLQASVRRTAVAIVEQLAGFFRQGIEEGVFQSDDPDRLAHMYFGLCKGALYSKPDIETPKQREELCRSILSTFLNGIAKEKMQIG